MLSSVSTVVGGLSGCSYPTHPGMGYRVQRRSSSHVAMLAAL